MPRGEAAEPTEFVRALQRARQVRRRANHDKESTQLCGFANYLDAHADGLEAKPTGCAAAEVPPRPPKDRAQTVTITERTLVARINRKLRHDLMALRRPRLNIVQDTQVDPVEPGNTLDCLKPWERLVGE